MPLKIEETTKPLEAITIPSDALPFVGGVSPASRALQRVIAEVAPTDLPVLLVGESGTGKDVLALELHRLSRHSRQRFVKVNCSGIAANSLEAYLGSHMMNSEADAANEYGTVFFDDIGRLHATNQESLLGFLSDGASAPKVQTFGHRVISSSTHSLEELVRVGDFREELYYRINGVCLRLPSLRDRQQDLPLLLEYFLKKYTSSLQRPAPVLSSATKELLRRYSWPGNVRELETFVRNLVISGDERLPLSDLVLDGASKVVRSRYEASVSSPVNKPGSLKAAAREASRKVERKLILKSLERTHWNRKRTARELQISYRGLLYKLKQLDIEGASDLAPEIQVPE